MTNKTKILQKVTIYPAKNAPETGSGVLAYAQTIVNNMKVTGRICRTKKDDLVVYIPNTLQKDGKRFDNFGFASELEEEEWKEDIIQEYELSNK